MVKLALALSTKTVVRQYNRLRDASVHKIGFQFLLAVNQQRVPMLQMKPAMIASVFIWEVVSPKNSLKVFMTRSNRIVVRKAPKLSMSSSCFGFLIKFILGEWVMNGLQATIGQLAESFCLLAKLYENKCKSKRFFRITKRNIPLAGGTPLLGQAADWVAAFLFRFYIDDFLSVSPEIVFD